MSGYAACFSDSPVPFCLLRRTDAWRAYAVNAAMARALGCEGAFELDAPPDALCEAAQRALEAGGLEHTQVELSDGRQMGAQCFPSPEGVCVLGDLSDSEKLARLVVNRIVEMDDERIAVFDALTGRVDVYEGKDGGTGAERGRRYDELMGDTLRALVPDEAKRNDLAEKLRLERVTEALGRDGLYSVDGQTEDELGQTRQKNWRFAYLDASRRRVLLTRTDVTDLFESERKQKLLLTNALAQARQASAAKSEFLSRMSHEIRTPMNAIIGMTTLAAQAVDDPSQVAEYLSKVGISARFLLSLINDILDMSRIESGRVSIKREEIPFEEFISGINAICYAQASAKNVDYDAVMTSFTEDAYIGDAMKLQQVLVNIIGNAIKFTQPGGRVQFMVHQEKLGKEEAHMRFSVVDTGVGISESFLPHLFEPFEQEHTGRTSEYGGTGLGLAICKSLVDLMGGTIRVNSIRDVGSEFVVELKLGISEKTKRRTRSKGSVPFEKMSALVVDDEIVVCRQTRLILEDMGMKAEWVTSGAEAVRLVRERWNKGAHFDVILIDWKMPEMDGIETARQIREFVGPEVTIIIITAYDWAAIEVEAKKVGVNMLISKPLFRSSLCTTFERIYAGGVEETEEPPAREYDFTGKRVLLVEDHAMNVEVARRLITAKHAQVEVAENGLIALERFAEKPVGYYDLIFMDIRMPVMDGLTAARSIRQMTKANAKTIPIVAMSANAFDEDVDKSKAAGMNAHMTKPIDPALLYQILADYTQDIDDREGEKS